MKFFKNFLILLSFFLLCLPLAEDIEDTEKKWIEMEELETNLLEDTLFPLRFFEEPLVQGAVAFPSGFPDLLKHIEDFRPRYPLVW